MTPLGGSLAGSLVAGRYRVTRALSSGAMGELYDATRESDGARVALKVIRPDLVDERFRQRFAKETLATQRLDHPLIVRTLDSGIDNRSEGALPYLVLELLEGRTLHDAVKADGALPWRHGVELLADVARALAAAHGAHVIHRDLKPKNVFLARTENGERVKVLDFGIAKILDDDTPGPKTTTGVVLGTPGYLAPERLRGDADDPRADLYALGCIAWDVLAGRAPFEAPTNVLLAVRHMSERAPSLLTAAEVPDGVALLVSALLEKSPARRPASAAAVVNELMAVLAQRDFPSA